MATHSIGLRDILPFASLIAAAGIAWGVATTQLAAKESRESHDADVSTLTSKDALLELKLDLILQRQEKDSERLRELCIATGAGCR